MNHTDPKTNDGTNDYMQENGDDASQEQAADDDDSHAYSDDAYSDDAYENDAMGDRLQFQARIDMPCLQEQIRVSS